MRVFISYSSKDGEEYAKQLHVILKNRGHDPFLVDHDMLYGEKIWDIIPKECLERDRVIFIITPLSIESKGQKQEYDIVVNNYQNRITVVYEKSNYEETFKHFPLLKPYKALDFNDSNLKNKCEKLSANLVMLQDKERLRTEPEVLSLPKLSQEGLNKSEIINCIDNLNEGYQYETIIPEICRTRIYEEKTPSIEFVDIFIGYHVPRDWFFPNQLISSEHLFREWGRSIAIGERKYIQEQIKNNDKISRIEGDFSPESIFKVIKELRKNKFEPNVIFTPIKYSVEMNHWIKKACVKYSNLTPRPRLISSLIINGSDLKIVPSPELKDALLLFNSKSLIWHVKKYPEYGALFIALGNHRLYPLKYVEVIAKTTVSCKMISKGISILKIKE